MARPTIFSKEIIQKTKLYLETYQELEEVIPSIAGLSCFLGIARDTIYDWSSQEDKQEFSDTIAKIMSDQEKTLINKGLQGDFNANITKLVLGKHGYKDNADVTTGGDKINLNVIGYKDNNNSLSV